jgi:uroporphyrinogen III methyltransferase/synthase
VSAAPHAAPPRGTVYLVGAGPGDPGLLTVRARDLLARCDTVVYDALANQSLLAEARARGAELHFVGKRGGDERSARQDSINELLVRLGASGRLVVRLKGGDPLVFGRGSEEAQALAAAGVPFEIVPGVTAGVAAAAYAGIPVTHRGLATSVTFVTGHEDPAKDEHQTDWAALARAGGTIVLYMGVKRLPHIVESLAAGGMPLSTPAAAIEWGTHPRQRTVLATVDTIVDRMLAERIAAPVIVIVGEVAALREEIAWFDRRPLFGRRVVVTRATEQAGSLVRQLAELGAEVLEMPAMRVEPLDAAPLARAVERLTEYQWLMFTSQNAVRLFWDALRAAGRDARALAGLRLCAVGPATADALAAHGIVPDVTPERFVAEGILEAMRGRGDVHAARVLYAAAEGARDVLPRGLRAMGAQVEVLPLYRSVPDGEHAEELRAALEEGRVDAVTFASASAVRGFVDAVGAEAAARAPGVSIGPVTTEAARDAGLRVAAEADEATVPSLAAAVVAALGSRWEGAAEPLAAARAGVATEPGR